MQIYLQVVLKVTVVLYISTDEGKSFESRLSFCHQVKPRNITLERKQNRFDMRAKENLKKSFCCNGTNCER